MQVMTPLETMAMILAVAAGTVITRFLPFWTDVLGPTHAIPEIVALAVIYVLHRIKHNALLSIAGGTAVYVLLLRLLSAAA